MKRVAGGKAMLLSALAVIAALPAAAEATEVPAAALICESLDRRVGEHRLSDAGFTRIHARVKVKTVIDTSPVIVIQQRSPAGERLNFTLVASSPPAPGTPGMPLFSVYIHQTDKDGALVRSSEKALFYSSRFDLTLTRDAAGKARIDVRWDKAVGSDTVSAVLDSAGFPSGPVTLFCANGTFEFSDLEVE